MKAVGNTFIFLGWLAIVFDFGLLIYRFLFPFSPPEYSFPADPDGAWQLAVLAKQFAIGIGVGILAIAVGGFIRGIKSKSHETGMS